LLIGLQQRDEQVHRLEGLVPALAGQRLSLLDGLLALQGELVKSKGHSRGGLWLVATCLGKRFPPRVRPPEGAPRARGPRSPGEAKDSKRIAGIGTESALVARWPQDACPG